MNFQGRMLVFFLSGFVATSAAAIDIKPGEWEVETVMSGEGVPPGMLAPKMSICITAEQAGQVKTGSLMQNMPKDCNVKIIEDKSDSLAYEAACGGKMEMKGAMKKNSDNEIVTTVAMTTEFEGKKQTMNTVATQKFISATCSKGAITGGVNPPEKK